MSATARSWRSVNLPRLFGVLLCVFAFASFIEHFAGELKVLPVNVLMTGPFILLLLSIAVVPFISGHFWERNYPWVSCGLGAVAVVYYFFVINNGSRMMHTALEYYSFIALIGSLFVVSGGIIIQVKGRSTPTANVVMLAVGAVIANVFGTTGASMILIRPFLRMNKYRLSGYQVVFFIFIVSNIGGLLTPIGDPPLFLGYLKGIPFFWVISRTAVIWVIATLVVLAIFYFIDRHQYRKLPDQMEREIEQMGDEATIKGLHNMIFLLIILVAVFIDRPWREITMILSAVFSYLTTRQDLYRRNEFNFVPVKEVAILFAGIFATMVPVLDWLELNAAKLGFTEPGQFYWGSGILSSFLDNAPTYLTFLSAACGVHGLNVDNLSHINALIGELSPEEMVGVKNALIGSPVCVVGENSWRYVQAISAGAVLFGANTYIGNGPNFMVKSIAEQARVKMPSFFGYIVRYSIPVLIPTYALIWLIFFR